MKVPQSARRKRVLRGQLTSEALIQLDYIPPPDHLAPYITTFFLLRCEEAQIVDMLPAGLGILSVFMKGQGEIFIRNGTIDPSHRINILTPLSAAAPVALDGPWHAFGASLSPLGWAAVTDRKSAAQYGNRLHDATKFLSPMLAATGNDIADGWNAGQLDVQGMTDRLGAAIESLIQPVPSTHQKLIALVAHWLSESLSPRVDRLQDLVLYSPRQLQRLVDQYYGLPPKQLARKYRALRSAGLLADPNTTDDQVTNIAEQFYDQSHMIREISLFAGRTPARIGGADNPMLTALLDLRNFREIKPTMPEKKDTASPEADAPE